MGSHFCEIIEITAFAASAPFVFLALAWDIFKQVIIPFPIGFLESIDIFIIALVQALEINSKCGVCPLITQPSAMKASNFFKYLEIVTGISKTPGTFLISIIFFLNEYGIPIYFKTFKVKFMYGFEITLPSSLIFKPFSNVL